MAVTKTIEPNVLFILAGCEIEGNLLMLPDGNRLGQDAPLERPLYVKVDKVLKALGGKWNRGRGGHVFASDPTEMFDTVLRTGEVTNLQQKFQAFNTPDDVADHLIQLANVSVGHRVLEPSAGTGNILSRLLDRIDDEIDFCEIQNKLATDLESDELGTCVGNDFLAYVPGPVYDRIVANPPFSKHRDIDHVTHMIECCKTGGRVVSVMSAGVTSRDDKRTNEFRELMSGCHGHVIHQLDAGSFKDSGTMVNTVIVVIDK